MEHADKPQKVQLKLPLVVSGKVFDWVQHHSKLVEALQKKLNISDSLDPQLIRQDDISPSKLYILLTFPNSTLVDKLKEILKKPLWMESLKIAPMFQLFKIDYNYDEHGHIPIINPDIDYDYTKEEWESMGCQSPSLKHVKIGQSTGSNPKRNLGVKPVLPRALKNTDPGFRRVEIRLPRVMNDKVIDWAQDDMYLKVVRALQTEMGIPHHVDSILFSVALYGYPIYFIHTLIPDKYHEVWSLLTVLPLKMRLMIRGDEINEHAKFYDANGHCIKL
jgi:hypothetical protein